MDGEIQLIANYAGWKAIKKIKITEQTEPIAILEFLASLTYSVDEKVEDNLRKIVELEKVDNAIKEISLSKGDIAKALEEVNSRNVSKTINEICKLEKFAGPLQKELIQLCKIYATKKALNECNLMIQYHEADISTLKRAKKAKAKKQ
jgi:hypothetical protein